MQSAIVSSGLFDIQFHIIDLHRFVLFGGFSFTFIIQSSNRPRNQPAEPRNPTLLKTASGFGPDALRRAMLPFDPNCRLLLSVCTPTHISRTVSDAFGVFATTLLIPGRSQPECRKMYALGWITLHRAGKNSCLAACRLFPSTL